MREITLAFRVSQDERQQLDDLARHCQTTPSEVIRQLIATARVEPVRGMRAVAGLAAAGQLEQ